MLAHGFGGVLAQKDTDNCSQYQGDELPLPCELGNQVDKGDADECTEGAGGFWG